MFTYTLKAQTEVLKNWLVPMTTVQDEEGFIIQYKRGYRTSFPRAKQLVVGLIKSSLIRAGVEGEIEIKKIKIDTTMNRWWATRGIWVVNYTCTILVIVPLPKDFILPELFNGYGWDGRRAGGDAAHEIDSLISDVSSQTACEYCQSLVDSYSLQVSCNPKPKWGDATGELAVCEPCAAIWREITAENERIRRANIVETGIDPASGKWIMGDYR